MLINPNNTVIARLKLDNNPNVLTKVMDTISQLGGNMGAIDIIKAEDDTVIRDLTIHTQGEEHAAELFEKLASLPGVVVEHISDRTFLMHLGGKLEVKSKVPIRNRDDLSMAYTPGVARICMAIHQNPRDAYNLTIKKNTVAIISDGIAVLGLGDIGPSAAIPVMEGKAMLLKDFAGVDAFPICLDTKDTEEIIRTITYLAPVFGAINLEDISAPRCFEIETRLKHEIDIPVFHDDQHGTAVVVLAAMINALKLVKKSPQDLKVVISGTGAAGFACTHILQQFGIKNIIGCDRKGALALSRTDLDAVKRQYAATTNPHQETGSIHEVIKNADVFIGVSAPNMLTVDDLKVMNAEPIIFALANPVPEIMPEIARPHVAIMATGRSDYPNQINNVLAFPGIFRGALDCLATDINEAMKLAAAHAIANVIPDELLSADYIVPSVFDANVVTAVADAVKAAAIATNVTKR